MNDNDKIEESIKTVNAILDGLNEGHKAKELLKDLFLFCGDAYNPDPKKVVDWTEEHWIEIRQLINPNFDDNE